MNTLINNQIVKLIHTFVIGILTPLKEKYPKLLEILNYSKHPSNDWDFFMTVGGVGYYVIKNKIDEEGISEIKKQLNEIDAQLPSALDNFFDFINKYDDLGGDLVSKIGFYVLWNIKGNRPSYSECKELAPAIGNYLLNLQEVLDK